MFNPVTYITTNLAAGLAVLLLVSVLGNAGQYLWHAKQMANNDLVVAGLKLEAAEQELSWEQAISEERSEYVSAINDAYAQQDAVLAGIDSGFHRLRQRFTCPKVPPTDTSPGGDGGAQTGLLDSDARFLVRFAGEADRVANQLALCQGVLKDTN